MKTKLRVLLLSTAAILLAMLLIFINIKSEEPVLSVQGTYAVQQDIYNSVYAPGEIEAMDSQDYTVVHAATVTGLYVKVGEPVVVGQKLIRVKESAVVLTDDTLQALTKDVLEGQVADRQSVTAALHDAAEQRETEYDVLAERAGTVLYAPESTGQSLLPGVAYLKTADTRQLRVRARIPETYIRQVAEGQSANVTCDAEPDVTVAATVTVVSPYARRAASLTGQQQTATVEAILSLIGTQETLRPGYTVSVKIFTDAVPDAVLVPYESVQQEGEQEFVMVVKNGIAHKIYVQTGYELDGYIEIKAGVDVGDIVLVSPPEGLKDGERVEVADT